MARMRRDGVARSAANEGHASDDRGAHDRDTQPPPGVATRADQRRRRIAGRLLVRHAAGRPGARAPALRTSDRAESRAPTTIPTAAPAARATEPAQPAAGTPATALPATPAPVPTTATAPSALLAAGIAQAATQFLASLDEAARSKATYAFGDTERQRWHWTTPAGFPRNGLPLNEMNPDQHDLAMDLLRASVSPAGYQKTLDIMSLQNDLGNDPELYFVTLFGAPGDSAPWGWRFEGHHISRHFTMVGEQVSMTPFFVGAWPTATNAGLRAMDREEQAARELVTSLEGANRETAIFRPRTLTNHVTQNQPFVSPLEPVGLPVGELDDDRKALVLEIIQTYLGGLPAGHRHAAVRSPQRRRHRECPFRLGWKRRAAPATLLPPARPDIPTRVRQLAQ